MTGASIITPKAIKADSSDIVLFKAEIINSDPLRLTPANQMACCRIHQNDLKLENKSLFSHTILYVSSKDCEKLSTQLREQGWAEFFAALRFLFSKDSAPITTDLAERNQLIQDPKHSLKLLIELEQNKQQSPLYSMILNFIGYYYFTGLGTTKNQNTAAEYFTQSKDLGNDSAMLNLGYINYVELGKNDSQKRQIGLSLYEQSMALGNPHAYYNLGCIYKVGGADIQIDLKKALAYFLSASKLGHPNANSMAQEINQTLKNERQKSIYASEKTLKEFNQKIILEFREKEKSYQAHIQKLTDENELLKKRLQMLEQKKRSGKE